MTQSSKYREKNPFEAAFEFARNVDEKQREVAVAIGLVVMKWNAIHDRLGSLFVEITQLDLDVAYAIWNSSHTDTAQRNLLRNAINTAYIEPRQLKVKDNLIELLNRIDGSSKLRNKFIHCPFSPSFDDNKIKIVPNEFSRNRHAIDLRDKDLQVELTKLDTTLDDLIFYASEIHLRLQSSDPNAKWPFE